MKKVIVIGAGIGGIVSALRLQKAGCSVTLIEKNKTLGGRLNILKEKGYQFDLGPSLIEWTEVYDDLFNDLGRKRDDYFTFERLDPAYTLFFPDGDTLTAYADEERLAKELERYDSNAAEHLHLFFRENKWKYTHLLHSVLQQDIRIGLFLKPENIYLALKGGMFTTYSKNLKKYFTHPKILALLSFQNIYFGTNPDKDNALYTILPYSELYQGVFYIKGGLYTIVKAFEQIANELGVTLLKEKEVIKICSEKKQVTGVVLNDKSFIAADFVIGNESYVQLQETLLDHLERDYSTGYLQSRKLSCSVITIYLGCSKSFEPLQHHSFFVASSVQKVIHHVSHHIESNTDFSFYVCNPVVSDKSVAPTGHSALFILIPIPNRNIQNDISPFLHEIKTRVYDHMEKDLHMVGLRESIAYEKVLTPKDWEEQFNLYKGMTFGLALNFSQLGPFRPRNTSKKMKGLYFVGSDMHPGSGLPPVVLSAKIIANKIIKKYG